MEAQTKKNKVTLLAENLYVIRSVRLKDGKPIKTEYYMTPAMWTRSPVNATIFCDYDAGTAHLNLFRTRDWTDATKWGDGVVEEFDVVPLYGELLKISNSMPNSGTGHTS